MFSFYDHLNVNTYIARTETPELRGDDVSYQAQLDYNGDRWGVRIDRLGVGANFNPEVGFVRRTDFRRNFASIRFSPRPESIAAVRKFSWESSLDYITDGTGLPETRIQMGVFGIEFENSDAFFAGVTNTYEFLKQPFVISRDISIPVGGYSFVSSGMAYSLGGQRMISGMLMFERGDINTFSAGSVWYQLPNRRPGWVSSGFVKPFTGLTGPGGQILPNNEIETFDAPLARDLLSKEQQEVWDGLMGAEMLGKTWIAPPGTPMEIVDPLRQAWQDLIADKETRAGFEKILGQPIEIFMSGAELQQKIVDTETAFLERYSTLNAVQEAVYGKYIN